MTPCEKLGYKVGDRFVARPGARYFDAGSIVEFTGEHGVYGNPLMRLIDGRCDINNAPDGGPGAYVPIKHFSKVGANGLITRTNGEPYATRSAAAQQVSAKGLNDTHEVIENGDGYAIAPKQREAEQPADADGWIEWHGGECPVERGTLVDIKMRSGADDYRLNAADLRWGHYHYDFPKGDGDIIAYRLHKPEQMEREQPTMTVIDTLRIAKRERDKAKAMLEQKEAVLVEAMDAVRAELGDGFELSEACDVRDLPPEEWREGDVLECIDAGNFWTKGGKYEVYKTGDGMLYAKDDDGDKRVLPGGASGRMVFHSRPTE